MEVRFRLAVAVGATLVAGTVAVCGAVEVRLPGVSGEPLELELSASGPSGRAATVRMVAPGTTTMDLTPGVVWRFEGEGPGAVVSPRTVLVRTPDDVLRLDLLPAALVRGRISVGPGAPRPPEVQLTIFPWPASGADDEPPFRRSCSVSPEGRFACQLPLGRFDLRIHRAGLLSAFAWDVTLKPSGLELGTLTMPTGTGLIVRVAGEDGTLLDGATVELLASAEGQPASRARSNAHGIALVRQISGGRWFVRASAPGYAPSAPVPVRVPENSELLLSRPLVLHPATPLHVLVDPPTDPFGEPWTVVVSAPDGERGAPRSLAPPARTDAGGWAEWKTLPAGPVRLVLRDSAGGLWGGREVDLAMEPQPVVFRLEIIDLQGRVVEPEGAAGTLTWSLHRRERDRCRIRVGLNPEGRFAVALPLGGRWTVTWTDPSGSESFPIAVEVPGTGDSELELRFPSGLLEGRVLDWKDRPALGARVQAFGMEARDGAAAGVDRGSAVVGPDGSFRMSVPPGRVRVAAFGQDGTSTSITVSVGEGTPVEVELRLPEPGKVRGRVVRRGGPAAGALVAALPMAAGAYQIPRDTTGADGGFTLDLGGMSRALLVVLSAEGAALRVVSSGEDGVLVELSEDGGTLHVSWPDSLGAAPSLEGPGWHASLALLAMLFRPLGATMVPGRATIPGLPPGRYRVCPPAAWPAAVESRCRDVDVFPAAEAEVSFGEPPVPESG